MTYEVMRLTSGGSLDKLPEISHTVYGVFITWVETGLSHIII